MALQMSPSSPMMMSFRPRSTSFAGEHGSFCSEDTVVANAHTDELESPTKCDTRTQPVTRELFATSREPPRLSSSVPNNPHQQENRASELPRTGNNDAAPYRRSNSDSELSSMHRRSLSRMPEHQIWSPTLDD
eukprot:1804984-Rhodomonas_salina.1